MISSLFVGGWYQPTVCLTSIMLLGVLVHVSASDSADFPFTTVIDILSENAEFSRFLRLLQRQGSVPFLNELQNYTLLAPVNSAFVNVDIDDYEAAFTLDNYILRDNVLQTSMIDFGVTVLDQNVRFPVLLEKSTSNENSIIWVNDAMIVDPDLSPNFQNATVHGISTLINDPPSLIEFLQNLEGHTGEFSLFKNFLESVWSENVYEYVVNNNTILVPSDNNFHKYFNQLEINYILDTFRRVSSLTKNIGKAWHDDRLIFWKNIVTHDIHGGLHVVPDSTTNLNDDKISIKSNNYGSTISVNNSTPSINSNIIFNRGIAHCFNDIQFLAESIHFNAEKYLHGMNSSDFVRELYFRNLQKMIGDESLNSPITIFVPETSSEKFGYAKSNLLYHFMESQLWLENEFSGIQSSSKIFKSAFCSSNKRLGGNCQRLRITKNSNGYTLNEKYKILHTKPFEIGKTLIYTISEVLQLPADFISSLNPFYHCSKSLELLRKINLLDLPPNNEGYTILLPCFQSWEFLDLNLEYLQRNITAIELMMKNLVLKGLIYTNSDNIDICTSNMLGENVSISLRHEKKCKEVSLNLSSIKENIQLEKNLDVFFSQGVVHPLTRSYFSNDLDITLTDLIGTTGTTIFIDFLNKFDDFAPILNNGGSYSLLVPTKNSLLIDEIDLNFTKLYDWLNLHIIPGNATNNLLECKNPINTTAGEPLTCRESSPGNYLLQLKNGNDNEVRILKRGCSSFDVNSCVFLIDRPISLEWLRPNKYRLKLPGVALGIGIVVGAISVLALLFCILLTFVGKNRGGEEATNLSVGTGNADVATPLLHGNNVESNSLAGSNDYQERRFESSYSSNSNTQPISVYHARTSINPV